MDEQTLLERLATIRAELAVAVAEVEAGRVEAPTVDDRAGAYRAVAEEEPDSLRERTSRAATASERRARLREEETEVLVSLEFARRAQSKRGVKRAPLLTLLDVPIAAPCVWRWCDLEGDGDVRKCTGCGKTVRNVVGLDPHAAAEVLASASTSAKLHRRADGTLIAGNCEGTKSERWRRDAITFGIAAVGLALVGTLVVRSPGAEASPASLPAEPTPSSPLLSVLLPQRVVIDITPELSEIPTLSVELAARSDGDFMASGGCREGPNFTSAIVRADTVAAFVAAVDEHRPDPDQPQQPCPIDARSTVALIDAHGTTTIVTSNCHHRWSAGEWRGDIEPLDEIADDYRDDGVPHRLLSLRFDELLHQLPVVKCPTRPLQWPPTRRPIVNFGL